MYRMEPPSRQVDEAISREEVAGETVKVEGVRVAELPTQSWAQGFPQLATECQAPGAIIDSQPSLPSLLRISLRSLVSLWLLIVLRTWFPPEFVVEHPFSLLLHFHVNLMSLKPPRICTRKVRRVTFTPTLHACSLTLTAPRHNFPFKAFRL
jgi:hypothetical protein